MKIEEYRFGLKTDFIKENYDFMKQFKDGVADALLNGNMADEYRYGYKQGYDFGIEMYSEINKLDEEKNEIRT